MRSAAEALILGRRPMWRRRLTFIASLMLLVVLVTLWISSYWVSYGAGYVLERPVISIIGEGISDGRMHFAYMAMNSDPGPKVSSMRWDSRWLSLGRTQYTRSGWCFVSIHCWIISLLAALVCAVALRDVLRAHRRLMEVGMICHACGYDLRGSSERCPECGARIPPLPERERVGVRVGVGVE